MADSGAVEATAIVDGGRKRRRGRVSRRALDIDLIDAGSLRTIVQHRSDRPVELFPLDGRPHLAHVRVEVTNLWVYRVLLEEVMSGTRPRRRARCC